MRLGLNFKFPELLPQACGGDIKFLQVVTHLHHLLLQQGPENTDFTRRVHQRIQQVGIDTNVLADNGFAGSSRATILGGDNVRDFVQFFGRWLDRYWQRFFASGFGRNRTWCGKLCELIGLTGISIG